MTSDDVWVERVLAWRASGETAADFCAGKAFTAGSLHTWSSRLGASGRVPRSRVGRRPMKFARLVSGSAASWHGDVDAHPRTEPASTMVITVGASRIEVTSGFDPMLLRAIVATLSGSGR